MRIDVSEVKDFKSCRRKWQFASRNMYHLQSRTPSEALHTGTMFHEALHSLYLGGDLEKIKEWIAKESVSSSDACLLSMVTGYAKNVLPKDLERFKVLDIEHKFEIQPEEDVDIQICGSIDMIVVDKNTNEIFGFEHKTAKKFRDTSFLWMDEQPRIYTVALKEYVANLNQKSYNMWVLEGCPKDHEPVKYTLGGLYINEVKKLCRDFQNQRTLCTYPDDDLENFFNNFFDTCFSIRHAAESDSFQTPTPGYFNCSMCAFRGVCETYMYRNISKKELLDEFSEELVEREVDHLDEKVERSAQC